ncbi:MAG: hypothetical protein KGZ49_08305 [Syntrophaceae bacterium]|nr:hypothetical protein [Syntrophaceae bacterium]
MRNDEMGIDADMDGRRRLGLPKGMSKVFPLIYAWLCLSLETLTYVPIKLFFVRNEE